MVLRDDLAAGDRQSGPALIIEPQTTTFVSRDFEAVVESDGTLLLTKIVPEVRT